MVGGRLENGDWGMWRLSAGFRALNIGLEYGD